MALIVIQIYFIVSIKKAKEPPKEKVKLTDEQLKKQEELRKSFENLMGYGYDDALKKKE